MNAEKILKSFQISFLDKVRASVRILKVESLKTLEYMYAFSF
jgi:hypothetical protein